MPKPFDATTKWLVDLRPADWLALIGMPGAVGTPLDPEIEPHLVDTDLAAITAAADRVIRVYEPAPELVDLEFLTGHHGHETAATMLLYSRLLTRKFALPVRSVIILLRPEADSPLLTGKLEERYGDGTTVYLTFGFVVVRVWDLDVEAVLRGGIGTLPLAPLANVSADAIPDVIRRMQERLDAEAPPELARELWSAAYIIMGLRFAPAVVQYFLKGVRQMRESSTYQAILDEGMEEGLQRGLERGLQQGLEQGLERGLTAGLQQGLASGQLKGERDIVLLLGARRFGNPSTETIAALEAIGSPDRLVEIAGRLLQVESWDELLYGGHPAIGGGSAAA
jgi:hypothetical protein